MRYDSAHLLLTIDLIGTFVFAVEGATAAIQGDLDLLGLMVLSFATALAGGIIRDLLSAPFLPEPSATGAMPPSPSSPEPSSSSGIVMSARFPRASSWWSTPPGSASSPLPEPPRRSTTASIPSWPCCWAASPAWAAAPCATFCWPQYHRPAIDIYAVERWWANRMVVGLSAGLPPTLMTIAGIVSCFVLRVVAVWRHWNLPKVVQH